MTSRSNSRQLTVTLVGDTAQFQQAMGQAQNASAGFDKKMQGLSASLGKIALPVAAIGAASLKAFGDFDQALTQSLAIVGGVTDEMRERFATTAKDVATSTVFSATQAAEAYFFLASAGLDAEQSIAALPVVAQFAQAGMFDMALATDLLTDAQSALGLSSDDAAVNLANLTRVSDVFVKANVLANTSVQQVAEALTNKAGAALRTVNKDMEEGVAVLAAYAQNGVKGVRAGEQLSIVIRDVSRVASLNADEFARFGIEVFDGAGNLNNFADIIEDFENALLPMSDSAKAATFATLQLGEGAGDAIRGLLGTSGNIREYEAALRDAGGVTEEIADNQMKSLQNQLGLVKDELVGVALIIGEDLAPVLLTLAEGVSGLAGEWANLPPFVREASVDLGGVIVTMWAVSKAVAVVSGALAGLAKFTGAAVAPVVAVGAGFLLFNRYANAGAEAADDYTRSIQGAIAAQEGGLRGLTTWQSWDTTFRDLADARTAAIRQGGRAAREAAGDFESLLAAVDSELLVNAHLRDIAEGFTAIAEGAGEATTHAEGLQEAVRSLAQSYGEDLNNRGQEFLNIFEKAPKLEVVKPGQLLDNLEDRADILLRWAEGLERLSAAELPNLEIDFRTAGPEQLRTLEALLADLDAGGARAFLLEDMAAAARGEWTEIAVEMGLALADGQIPLLLQAEEQGRDVGVTFASAIAAGLRSTNLTIALSASASGLAARALTSANSGSAGNAGGGVRFRAGGGRVFPGTPYVVGELRPELFIPDTAGTIMPDASRVRGSSGGSGAGGMTVNIDVDARGAADPDRVAYAIRRELSRELTIYETGAGRRT